MRRYVLLALMLSAAFLLGWIFEMAYYFEQIQELCGMAYLNTLAHPFDAIECIMPREQGKVFFWPAVLSVVTFILWRNLTRPSESRRKWPT